MGINHLSILIKFNFFFFFCHCNGFEKYACGKLLV
jgi:hypothetical protein